ncbi:MAG: radical SAM protein [Treponema sp.]|nr:radical SAM protein [Treponema sp.]
MNRLKGEQGYCRETATLRLACASIHRGEEPPVTGQGGSGTIFVSGCNLGCTFCQNWQISRCAGAKTMGREVSSEEFAAICIALEEKGAENINIVTGSHAIPAIAEGIDCAREQGLKIPVLWNSSAYETEEALEILNTRVDAWLPDLKTLDPVLASRYFNARDYPERAKAAILKMLSLPHSLIIVRHLILPGHLESTREVLQWFAHEYETKFYAENAKNKVIVSIMTQFTPVNVTDMCTPHMRYVNREEYEQVLDWLGELGIEEGYCQELVRDSGWLPDFGRRNPFSARGDDVSELSSPVWHWKDT